jgi:hypothetical protein
MTQDEIIEMYLQVSKEVCNDTEWCWAGAGEPLQMFAKLVAAKAMKQRTWVGLTKQQRNNIEDICEMIIGEPAFNAIEAQLKENNA